MANAHYIKLLQERREIRRSLIAWANFRHPEKPPHPHHELLLTAVQALVEGRLIHPATNRAVRKLIVEMPPGAAKSTYISVDTPPWYLARFPAHCVLACSHNKDLITGFSRQCRNTIDQHGATLGYGLCRDSHAVDEWRTDKGGLYFCAGVGAGIAGHRANLGIIDDYLGDEETAQSKDARDKQWAWYENDFSTRLTNDESTGTVARQIILATPRHEDDLIGRLLAREPDEWYVLKIPFFPVANDPLGRPVAETVEQKITNRLWPEHFSEDDARDILRKSPRTISCLFQLDPHPETGDFFHSEWFIPYATPSEIPDNLRHYGAGDFGISERRGSNSTCLGFGGLDNRGHIWILPSIFWEVAGPKKIVSSWLTLLDLVSPIEFWAEKGHISKSLGPFLKEMMLEEKVYVYIKEITPTKDKETRAQTIRGLAEMGRVHVPTFAPWWPAALHELTTFPRGRTDDFVDMFAHLGMGLRRMMRAPGACKVSETPDLNTSVKITHEWLRQHDKTKQLTDRYQDR